MKNQLKRLAIASLAIILIIAQCGCGKKPSENVSAPVSGEAWLLNTFCSISVYGGSEELIDDAFSYAQGLENLLSKTVGDSIVGRLNSGEEIVSFDDPRLADVFLKGIYYGELTDGRFDITIGSVSNLWDFTSGGGTVPSAEDVENALNFTGAFRDIVLREKIDSQKDSMEFDCIEFKNKNSQLDLGAIAKGFIEDMTAEYLLERGAETAVLNFGGNVLCLGKKPQTGNSEQASEGWNIGIEAPGFGQEGISLSERETIGYVTVESGAVATSGTYERCFEENGRLYHHVLDPATGYPAETDLVSATVTGPVSADCDALSTCCLLYGAEKAPGFMAQFPDYSYILITGSGEILSSQNARFTEF